VLLALGQLIGQSVEQHFIDLDRDTAEGKFTTSASVLARMRTPRDLERIGSAFESMLVGHDGLAMRVEDRSGRVLFGTAAGRAAPSAAASTGTARGAAAPGGAAPRGKALPATTHDHSHQADHGAPLPVTWTHDGRTFRGLARELPTGLPDRRPLLVTIGVDTAHHDHYMVAFRRTLWTFVAIAMAIMGLLGWVSARSGLAPLRRLGREAESVTAASLDRRLSSGDLPVEVAELARSLNDMLARLEDSFTRLSELSSDLAHELRTPLSNLMTQTQVGLSKARSADDYREVLANNSEELERLARMVSDMLFLAKSEHGLARPANEPVDLEALARQVCSFYEALAAERQLGMHVEGRAVVDGDRSLLLRALANLVSNAIRHAAADSEIVLRIAPVPAAGAATPDTGGGQRVRLSVINFGDTIPPEVLSRMFDRFFRGDSSRQHDTEGAGLGLAIARSIAQAHGGTIGATSEQGVTEVFLDLPVARLDLRERNQW
jgi:two-component system heavy metal sensor histidine kinase CusS